MSAGRLHFDEVDTDVPLIGRLLATQFPHWADRSGSTAATQGWAVSRDGATARR